MPHSQTRSINAGLTNKSTMPRLQACSATAGHARQCCADSNADMQYHFWCIPTIINLVDVNQLQHDEKVAQDLASANQRLHDFGGASLQAHDSTPRLFHVICIACHVQQTSPSQHLYCQQNLGSLLSHRWCCYSSKRRTCQCIQSQSV